ncbi:TYW1 [Cordylochernes scorpioides]|uniref:TYW1 n=1 Tax=Cordylochernes scorpioides TaxID=51811 RepID=A0ABY6KI06_9ARAC|nr:TYW1 [Cordylochernes scorpioides]
MVQTMIIMNDPILDSEITNADIYKEIAGLRSNKACGPDGIPNEVLKTLPDSYILLLKQLYNSVMTTGKYPAIWTNSTIHPIFKNGYKNSPSNYRDLPSVNLPEFGDIHLLLYADDIAIIGESRINLQKKIKILKEYLDENLMTLNESKSKIMVFRNGGLKFAIFSVGSTCNEEESLALELNNGLKFFQASLIASIYQVEESDIESKLKEFADVLNRHLSSNKNDTTEVEKREFDHKFDVNKAGGKNTQEILEFVDHNGEELIDLEDLGEMFRGKKSVSAKEMLTPVLRANLTKQGYKLVGSHSAVKMCRWTKAMLRGRGGCYKHTFYGIASHRCMEATPSLACANKCTFCWRHQTNPVATEWKWKTDPPREILAESLENHRRMIWEFRGVPGVVPQRIEEGLLVKHCALSLVGEPVMYPAINELVDLLHARSISTFVVTNAQFPDRLAALRPVTQLYVSVDATTKESLRQIDRPLFRDFWERFVESLKTLASKGQRTVYRLTLVNGRNTEDLQGYARLVDIGKPDFIEVKGVTYCGQPAGLTMADVPRHGDVVDFARGLADRLRPLYDLACEHEHSNCVLLAHRKFKINNSWNTWIDYDKFHSLVAAGSPFTAEDYTAITPDWALFGAEQRGFDPQQKRHGKCTTFTHTSIYQVEESDIESKLKEFADVLNRHLSSNKNDTTEVEKREFDHKFDVNKAGGKNTQEILEFVDHNGEELIDLEDLGEMFRGKKSGSVKEMLTPVLRANLTKQGYKLVGSHSAVKMCRWTKAMLRGRGGCYKHTFYGIASHRCMEATPSLACANKCTFCWRHQTNPVATEWKWKTDPPREILAESLENHRRMIWEFRGVPGVVPQRIEEGLLVKHCALSLVGEPVMYPAINELVDLLHARSISTFVVTNAQFPDRLAALRPVTQLYVSVDATTKESLRQIDRPLFRDFWERFVESLKTLASKGQRTVYRLTLVNGRNTEDLQGYARLVDIGKPDFIEVKGVTYCGQPAGLTMADVPRHGDVVDFARGLADRLRPLYDLACEHEHSNCVLLAHRKFKINNSWNTWIDYDKFHSLVATGSPFTAEDYTAITPDWALFGAEQRGFDPQQKRHGKCTTFTHSSVLSRDSVVSYLEVITISRRLVANGLHSCRPLRRLPLTPPNRRQRLEWCRARSTWMTEWHRVVFSDESRFCLSSDSRRVRVWRRRGERSNPAAIVERPTVRQRGIMVWGAIAYDSRSPLLRIQGTMTAQRYVDDVLRPVTLPYLQGVPNALYQQDNARPHTARISQQALQDVQMLPWPPYSPDLSPIELVWDIIGRRLHALPQPRSEDELWQMVEREWRAIPQDAIRTLIDSLPRRVAACIAVRGGPTCY